MSDVQPSPCCRAAAIEHGVEPSLDFLCHSCADYRSFRHHILDAYPNTPIPAGFKHTPYSEFNRNGTEEPARPVHHVRQRQRGKRS